MKTEAMSAYKMADVGDKVVTHRRAVARGEIHLSEIAFAAFNEGRMKKGDPRTLAEVAGMIAAKRTPGLLPLCHPLALDRVRLAFSVIAERRAIEVYCEVETHAKTGVEMEALTGVSVALLNLYDVCKAEDPALTITGIRLDIKEGGKTGRYTHPDKNDATPFDEPVSAASVSQKTAVRLDATAAVITASDRASAGEYEDRSGPALVKALTALGASVVGTALVPDETEQIAAAIRKGCGQASLVVVTGGTGLSPRDVTPEAMTLLGAIAVPGFGELMRSSTAAQTQKSYLSRGGVWTLGASVVLLVPGSERGAIECLEAVAHLIPHAIKMRRGEKH